MRAAETFAIAAPMKLSVGISNMLKHIMYMELSRCWADRQSE